MSSCGYWYGRTAERTARRPGVGQGKGRGITKPPLRKRRRRR